MKILLIYPAFAEGYQSPARMEPLALAILAALTPKEHEIQAVDERFEPLPDGSPDLVGISVCTFSARRAYGIAARYRQSGCRVVLGGFHPTLHTHDAMEHADAVVVGDAEASWPQVLRDTERGCLKRLYLPGSRICSEGVAPDRSVFQGKKYLPISLVQSGRGCPRFCEFCSVRSFYGGQTSQRPIEEVVRELRSLPHRRVFFVDDNLMADPARLRALLEAITPLALRWTSQMDIGIADDPGLLRLAAESGCQSLTIGLESLNEENLRRMGKAWNCASRFASRLRRIRDAGIMVYASFVFGYDEDRADSFERTLHFALDQKLFIANFSPLQPLPGTPLYDRLSRENRLVYPRWWMEPGYRWHEALMHPRGMSARELTEGCRRARERFHSLGGIARRLLSRAHLASVNNLAVYLAANWVSKREIAAKSHLQRRAA